MNPHKIKAMIAMALAAAGGGAISAVMNVLMGISMDPPTFDLSNPADWQKLWRAAIGGAAAAVLYFYQNPPRDPTAWQRKDDPTLVIKAAEKMGVIGPERAARAKRETDAVRKRIEHKVEMKKDDGGGF